MERQVFQRENVDYNSNFHGDGDIQISGNFTVEYDSIMAKVEPRVIGQGTATAWVKINTRNGKPYFNGKLNVKGGWYTFYVKAYKGGIEVGSDIVQRVGMGEVFAIAGQSNAQGGDNLVAGFPAVDDRVSAIDYDNDSTIFNKLPIGFSKLDNDSSSLGSFHFVPWAWGKFGDILTTSLNVPVLIYGTAHGGTTVEWWKQAALEEAMSPHPPWVRDDLGAPYMALKTVLNYYASLTGLRAVIWHQGESDQSTLSNFYRDRLQAVIGESRTDSEHPNLAWMICRVSYTNGNISSLPVNGQTDVINNDVHVFAGPNTDLLTSATGSREIIQDVHFNQQGLIEFAVGLENYMNSTFFTNSVPLLASDFLDIDFSCNPGTPSTPISLTLSTVYDKYSWSNRNNTDSEAKGYSNSATATFTNYPPAGYERLNWQYDSTNSITVGAGRYALNVRKVTSEKVLFSPIMDLTTFALPTTPTFLASSSQIRNGDTLTLTGSGCNGTYLWSTLNTGNPLEIYPNTTANYTVTCKTLHCLSTTTAPVEVVVSSCFSDPLNLSGPVINSQSSYQSQQAIQSVQQISTSGEINYSAKNSVELNPGFESGSGSLFSATIEDCN